MCTGYAGPGWEWPKGLDFDCTASCCITAGNKSIETITGGNFLPAGSGKQASCSDATVMPPSGGPIKAAPLECGFFNWSVYQY